MFELQMRLSERFPSLTPLSLRKENAREVFLLIRRYSIFSANSRKPKNNIIRRPAGDDWF